MVNKNTTICLLILGDTFVFTLALIDSKDYQVKFANALIIRQFRLEEVTAIRCFCFQILALYNYKIPLMFAVATNYKIVTSS